jgi:hypothetical protein
MRASFHRRTAAEPSAPQPAPVKSDCRRLARVGAISPLLSAAPAQSIVAQPEQLVLLGVSGSQEAFAVPFSQAVFSLNRSSVLMAASTRSTHALSALRSASAAQPEAPNRSKRDWAALLQWAARLV